jgi:CheY-like chemotaxis protein
MSSDVRPHEFADRVAALNQDLVKTAPDGVLVVDDDADIRESLIILLGRAGYALVQASDGLDALRVLDQLPDLPRVVLADIQMPRVDGRELARRLRATRPQVRIILMSGAIRPGDERLADRIVHKPFHIGEVREAIVALLAQPHEA